MHNFLSCTFLAFFLFACNPQSPTEEESAMESLPSETKLEVSVEDFVADTEVRQFDMSDFETSDDGSAEPEQRLPNLFSDSPREKKTTVSGSLLRDEENPDLVQSLEGAEISIEVKTGK